MIILRSILAVVIGGVIAFAVIKGIETANFLIYRPADGKSITEQMKELEDPKNAKTYFESLPSNAFVMVLLAWQAGAFLGGGVAAWIAARARLVHAGVVGGLVLGGTIYILFTIKSTYDFSHPDWMIVLGLLLPLPVSLLAGKLVSILVPTPVAPVSNP